VICGTGDGEAWTVTVYWTGEEWSNHSTLARSRSRFGFPTEEGARLVGEAAGPETPAEKRYPFKQDTMYSVLLAWGRAARPLPRCCLLSAAPRAPKRRSAYLPPLGWPSALHAVQQEMLGQDLHLHRISVRPLCCRGIGVVALTARNS
jgi:hypothetical protein